MILASSFEGFPDSSVGKESACNVGDPVSILGREDPLKKGRLATPAFSGFPGGSADKESTGNVGDLGSIPELGRSPGEGNGYPLQYSGLENPMDCKESDTTEWLSLSLSSLPLSQS